MAIPGKKPIVAGAGVVMPKIMMGAAGNMMNAATRTPVAQIPKQAGAPGNIPTPSLTGTSSSQNGTNAMPKIKMGLGWAGNLTTLPYDPSKGSNISNLPYKPGNGANNIPKSYGRYDPSQGFAVEKQPYHPPDGATVEKQNLSSVPVPTFRNAATAPDTKPKLGYGGATYGTSGDANKGISANQASIANTPNFKDAEIKRTQSVIEARKAQGLDTSAQEKYLRVNLGYADPAPEEEKEDPATEGYKPLTPEEIAAEADAKQAAELAQREASAEATRRGLQADFDYITGINRDTRVLEDGSFQRNNDPAAWDGSTGYRGAMMDRNRNIQDTALQRDLGNQLATAQQGLLDFKNMMPQQRTEMINELTRIERQYGIDLGSQKLQEDEFEYNKTADQRDYDRGVVESDRTYNYTAGRDKVQDSQWEKSFQEEKSWRRNRAAAEDKQWLSEYNRGGEQFAETMGLNWAELSQRKKEFYSDAAYKWASLDAQQANQSQPEYSGMSAGQVLNEAKVQLMDSESGEIKTGVTPDKIYRTVVQYGLPDGQDDQVMMSLGLTQAQIDSFDKQYGVGK